MESMIDVAPDLGSLEDARIFVAQVEKMSAANGFASKLLVTDDKAWLEPYLRQSTRTRIHLNFRKDENAVLALEEAMLHAQFKSQVGVDRFLFRILRDNLRAGHGISANAWELSGQTLVEAARPIVEDAQERASAVVLGHHMFTNVLRTPALMDMFDAATKFEMVKAGRYGSLLGLDVYGEDYNHPAHRVFTRPEMWFFARPEALGRLWSEVTPVVITPTSTGWTWTWEKVTYVDGLDPRMYSVLAIEQGEQKLAPMPADQLAVLKS